MSSPRPLPTQQLVDGWRTKWLVAIACALVLIAGTLLAPRKSPPPPKEEVAPILEAEVARRDPQRLLRAAEEMAPRVLPQTVAFQAASAATPPAVADFARAPGNPDAPPGFGLLVSGDGEVLTHVDAVAGRPAAPAILGGGRRTEARVAAYEPETGLVLVRLPERSAVSPPSVGAEMLRAGSWALAAARGEAYEFVAPVVIAGVAADRYLLSGASPRLLPGTPLFDLEGAAVAVAGSDAVAYPVAPALSRLRQRLAEGIPLPVTLGLVVQPMTPPLARYLGAVGVVVADAREGGPAARAGIEPGDVLIRIGGGDVHNPADVHRFTARLAAGEPAPVTVHREGRTRTVDVVPDVTLARPFDPTRRPPAEGPRAAELFSSEALEAAGLRPDAVLLSINGVPAARAETELRRRRDGWLVHLEQQGRRFFAVVEPAA